MLYIHYDILKITRVCVVGCRLDSLLVPVYRVLVEDRIEKRKEGRKGECGRDTVEEREMGARGDIKRREGSGKVLGGEECYKKENGGEGREGKGK